MDLSKAMQNVDLKIASRGKADGDAKPGAFVSSLQHVEGEWADRLIGATRRLVGQRPDSP